MSHDDDLIFIDELPVTDPAELLRAMPELRQWVPDRADDVGLRSLLDRDDALSEAWSHVG